MNSVMGNANPGRCVPELSTGQLFHTVIGFSMANPNDTERPGKGVRPGNPKYDLARLKDLTPLSDALERLRVDIADARMSSAIMNDDTRSQTAATMSRVAESLTRQLARAHNAHATEYAALRGVLTVLETGVHELQQWQDRRLSARAARLWARVVRAAQ